MTPQSFLLPSEYRASKSVRRLYYASTLQQHDHKGISGTCTKRVGTKDDTRTKRVQQTRLQQGANAFVSRDERGTRAEHVSVIPCLWPVLYMQILKPRNYFKDVRAPFQAGTWGSGLQGLPIPIATYCTCVATCKGSTEAKWPHLYPAGQESKEQKFLSSSCRGNTIWGKGWLHCIIYPLMAGALVVWCGQQLIIFTGHFLPFQCTCTLKSTQKANTWKITYMYISTRKKKKEKKKRKKETNKHIIHTNNSFTSLEI